MDWSADVDVLKGKSSWTSMIGSTVTDGDLHIEHVTVDVRDPANVWSVMGHQRAREDRCSGVGKGHSRAIQLQLDICPLA